MRAGNMLGELPANDLKNDDPLSIETTAISIPLKQQCVETAPPSSRELAGGYEYESE